MSNQKDAKKVLDDAINKTGDLVRVFKGATMLTIPRKDAIAISAELARLRALRDATDKLHEVRYALGAMPDGIMPMLEFWCAYDAAANEVRDE